MRRSTISQALREMRGLHDTDAGRLRGTSLRHRFGMPRQGLTATPQPWRDRIQAGIEARHDGHLTADTPEYLVFSDGVLVVVLTAAAHLLLPDYPLTPLQARHQQAAAEALSDLRRHALADLADRAGAPDSPHPDHDNHGPSDGEPDAAGWLRVAPDTDPTQAVWVDIGPDLAAARRMLARATGTDPDRVLIIEANGYGRYGRDRHRHRLDVLCAMHQLAVSRQVSLHTVGEWLHAEGATTAEDLDPEAIVEAFAAAHLGPYACETDYARSRMRQLGWTQALQTAGIPDTYLDTAAVTRDWFTYQVRSIDPGTRDHIEVFTRQPRHRQAAGQTGQGGPA
jgi:hypothetical protein